MTKVGLFLTHGVFYLSTRRFTSELW